MTLVGRALAALTVPLPPGGGAPYPPITNVGTDLPILATGIISWIFWALIVFSIVMFLVGGYKYAFSRGDPEKVTSANRTLRYAAIAMVVAIVAAGIPLLVSSFFFGSFSLVL
jgi:magnesium-transporting ATPase (P-type)